MTPAPDTSSDSRSLGEGSAHVSTPVLDRLPRGQLEWSALLESLADIDDRAERYFLELKSQLDLSTEPGRAKVAKFILGAANRDPDKAIKRFQGHALLVIGIAEGVPFFEAKDLARAVSKFIGADGPGWDFERIPFANGKEVITIVVDPPRWRDPVYTCLKDGHENLKDGGIYVRADGETREARGDEVRVLLRRAQRKVLTAELAVSLLGSPLYYQCEESILDQYLEQQRSSLIASMDQEEAVKVPTPPIDALLRSRVLGNLGGRPEPRTPEQFLAEVSAWELAVRDNWRPLLDRVAGLVWSAAQIRVENLTKAFLEEVEVTVHLDGPAQAVDKISSDQNLLERIPRPPRTWGPIPPIDPSSLVRLDYFRNYRAPVINSPYGTVSFKNGGSVTLSLDLKELRPLSTYASEDDELVIVLDQPVASLKGQWQVTARGHHERYEGEFVHSAIAHRDFTSGMQKLLLDEDTSDNER